MKRKVLYLGGFEMPDRNAAAHRVLANAMTLRELGYDISFIGPTKDPLNCAREYKGFKFEFIDYPKTLWQWLRYITSFISIDKIIELDPDYVILYNFPAIASLRILRQSRKKRFKVFHDLTEWECSKGWTPREIIRKVDINLRMHYCMKKMDGVIAISRYLYDYYSIYTKVIQVPPTVDLTNPKFDRGRELTVGNPIQLVYAGSVGAGNKERLDYIVNTVSNINSLRLTVVGLSVEQYERVYGNLPEECTNVSFKGRVPHEEAVNIVCKSDFQMLIRENTLKNKAGFPTKFVESMSCCTPLIATASSNICDYLIDGETGFIVNNQNSLYDVLIKISLMSNDDIIRMKEKCRAIMSFDFRCYQEKFSRLFE